MLSSIEDILVEKTDDDGIEIIGQMKMPFFLAGAFRPRPFNQAHPKTHFLELVLPF